MIFVYFDKNGVIQEVVNDTKTRVGNVGSDKILCYFDGIEYDEIFCLMQYPNGDYSNEMSIFDEITEMEIPYDKKRDLKYFQDYKKYKFYTYTLEANATQTSGLAKVTIRGYIDDKLYAQGMLTFHVQENIINEEQRLTQSQYDYMLIEFARKSDYIHGQMQELKDQLTYNRLGLLKVTEYDEDTGEVVYIFDPTIVDDISYDEETGEIAITY